MSIKSFFKPTNVQAHAERDEERPLKKAKLVGDDDHALTNTANSSEVSVEDGPKSPGALLSSQETPRKADSLNASAKSAEGNSTMVPGLTAEQLEKIEQKRQLALARKELLEKSSAGEATLRDSLASLDPSWRSALDGEFKKDYFRKLDDFVMSERRAGKTVFPPAHQTFSAFNHCPFDQVRVVIVGQDPYHGERQAHGLCFSVQKGVSIPPSLLNMYKELEDDPAVTFSRPSHGCLIKWAEQGVLMLNACMSVRKGEANSHQKRGWETFTDAVIAAVNRHRTGVVFMLWGRPAQDKCKAVDKKRHFVLSSVHPSPLSAHRGFFGCRHFSRCNELLEARGKQKIEWQV